MDAIGIDRENDLESVDPTPQNVFVFRVFGVAVLVVGVSFLLWLFFG